MGRSYTLGCPQILQIESSYMGSDWYFRDMRMHDAPLAIIS
jgi:hypothetical protein